MTVFVIQKSEKYLTDSLHEYYILNYIFMPKNPELGHVKKQQFVIQYSLV